MNDPRDVHWDLPSRRLAGLAWGPDTPDPSNPPPVLAIHGWLDNARSFHQLAPLLARERPVVALDLPGHGRSDPKPPGCSYYFTDWVLDVVDVLDALDWQRCTLLGHSMGAGVAALTAAALGQRVRGLAMIEGLGPIPCPPDALPARLAKSLGQRHKEPRLRVFPTRDDAAARLREANPQLTPDAAHALVERGTRPTDGGFVWSSDPRLRGTSPFRVSEAQVRAFLRAITCPTVVVRAQHGLPADPTLIAERLSCFADVRTTTLPGGHHLHMDDPQPVLTAIQPTLQGEPTPPPTIRAVILDVDGVLTDGGLSYDATGETKRFSVRDGLGIKRLVQAGIPVALLSGRNSQAVERRATELGIAHIRLGVHDKIPVLEELLATLHVDAQHVAYMGDDLPDLPVLRRVGTPTAPADATPEVLDIARWVAPVPGGHGAVRALAEWILRPLGHWTP